MKRERILPGLLWLASGLWLGLCLFLSWQPGEETAALSGQITAAVMPVISLSGYEPPEPDVNYYIRKAAHMGVFGVLGLLLGLSFRRSLRKAPRGERAALWLAVAVGVFFSVIAEVGKLWIPGRHLDQDEILLNIAGLVCGAGAACLSRRIFKQR